MSFIIKQSLDKPAIKLSRSINDDSRSFDIITTDNIVIETASFETQNIVNDVIETTHSAATIHNAPVISTTSNDFSGIAKFRSTDTNILTIDSGGNITKISNGTAGVVVGFNGYHKRETVSMDSYIIPESHSVEFVSGSVGKNATDNVDSRIVGKNMDDNGHLYMSYTSENFTNLDFVRNENVWCSDIDLTCISPLNSWSNNRRAGTLITPRHVLNVAHGGYYNRVGDSLYFVSQDGNNTVYERTVTAWVVHPEANTPDIAVVSLDEDLPSDKFKPCKLLPANYNEYLIETRGGRPPGLLLDQEEKALIHELDRIYEVSGNTFAKFEYPSVNSKRYEFREVIILGDSGNPGFLILDLGNGPELVLVTLWTGGSGGGGTFMGAYIPDINTLITDLDTQAGIGMTGYTVTEADLSGFTKFV